MAHTLRDKKKLLDRARKIQGQAEAVVRALDQDRECADILQMIAACRGAINGLMAVIVEGHIRYHVLDPQAPASSEQSQAAEELIDVVRAYLR